MKVIDATSDLAIVLKHSKVSKDSRINDKFLLSRFNAYRSKEIRDSYKRNREIDPTVQQDFGAVEVTKIASNDPIFGSLASSKEIGKVHIPTPVSLPNDKGIVSIHPESRIATSINHYYGVSYNAFGDKINNPSYCNFKWYSRVQNDIYLHPFASTIRAIFIIDNPMEGYVLQTYRPGKDQLIYQTEYTSGESYTVVSGTITHDGTIYTANQSFIAQNPDYSGNGVLRFTNQRRKMTLEDEYPISYTMTEVIMMKILQKDFGLEKQEIADIRNNANDDLILLKQE